MKAELEDWKIRLVHDEADMVRFQHRFASALSGDEIMGAYEFNKFVEDRRYLAECIDWAKRKIVGLEELIRRSER